VVPAQPQIILPPVMNPGAPMPMAAPPPVPGKSMAEILMETPAQQDAALAGIQAVNNGVLGIRP